MSRLFNTLIVEDRKEPLEDLLRELLVYEKIIKIGAVAKTYDEARIIVLTQKFDLSILDKDLDEGYNCFDLIRNSYIDNFGIIALNSKEPNINLETLGLLKELPTYILKPYVPKTVGDFIKRLNEIKVENKNSKIFLNTGHDGIIPIYENSILFIEAEGGCSVYHLNEPYDNKTKITISESLGDQELKLASEKFLRVHKSFIVNIDKIVKFKNGETRTSGKLLLNDDSLVDYALTNHDKIVQAMKNRE